MVVASTIIEAIAFQLHEGFILALIIKICTSLKPSTSVSEKYYRPHLRAVPLSAVLPSAIMV